MQEELGIAYLFITHNFGVVEYLADRIAVMDGGRIVELDQADAVLHAPRQEVTRKLLAAVPRRGAPRPKVVPAEAMTRGKRAVASRAPRKCASRSLRKGTRAGLAARRGGPVQWSS